jgi:hypothetical protein
MDGKREISCGYTYELCEENGQYIQRKIRGNHVAVVDAGRAGPRVCIKDQKPKEPERRTRIMKKSLSKILARMAKDGDIETVAEIIEEMIEPEGTAEAEAAAVAEEVAEAVETVAAEPAAVVETPEGATIVVDEDTLGGIISRLDQIIQLLTPVAAADDDPVEEIAEAVEEAIEAAAAAEEEAILPDEDLTEGIMPEDVAEIVEEILEPAAAEAVSEVLDPLEDECDPEDQEVISTNDALRNALNHYKHKLARMPAKKRRRVCADIAARLGRSAGRRGTDTDAYTAIAARQRKSPRGNPTDLGKRIMASRNVNMRK